MGLAERRERAQELLGRLGHDALILQTYPNFAWYTDGGDNRVDHSSPAGVASVVITRDRDLVLADNIEAERIATEQVPGFEVVSYPWYEGPGEAIRRIVGAGAVVSDGNVPVSSFLKMETEIARLRWILDEDAIARYASIGRDASAALEEAAAALLPGMTELEAAAEVLSACRRRGLFSPVVLAAGDDRIARYRHPVPSAAQFHRRAMLVVCAERGGLYANITQFVHFEEPDDDWIRRHRATEGILRRLRDEATRAGRTLGDVFEDVKSLYAEAGFHAEWTLHHQGGTTGYATREVIARPGSDVEIRPGMAFAWNPSITGAKSEETFVLTSGGPQVVATAAK